MNTRRPLLRLFPILLLNITGFAISIPVLPALAYALGGGAVDVGLLYATQAFGQFIMAPGWGALSDRFGRKHILMCTFGAAAIMELSTAFVPSLGLLFLARFLVGLCAGNVATATALIADATDASTRSKGMAIVGISFGVGFTLGPAIGAGVSLLTQPGAGILGAGLPFAVSAALSLITLVLAAAFLIEPVQDADERRKTRLATRPNSIMAQLRVAPIFIMCALFFLYTVAITVMEGTFFVYMADIYGYDAAHVGMIFAAMGLLMALFQGGVGWASRTFGDRTMTAAGLALLAVGLGLAPITGKLAVLLIFLAIATIGRAFVHPGILSMTSSLAIHRQETGRIMGILQSASSLGRVIGPALGGLIFVYVSPAAPFWFAGILLASAGLWWWTATRVYFPRVVKA
ncbi:MAG: MFS transporter [Bradymonadaceae bacterium]|nr:MFS transporter [Lujinxingiaceae bacterium]